MQCVNKDHIHNGTHHHQGKTCGRYCVSCVDNPLIADEEPVLIARLVWERLSLCGSGRAVRGSPTWLLHCMVERCASCSAHLHVQAPQLQQT